MAWIESHQTLWSHAKTRKGARRLDISPVQLVGHLHSLWHWAIDHAEDGNLTKYDSEDIAIAARWDGDPDEFVQALADCGPGDSAGYLERGGQYGPPEDDTTGELVLHDWWDYAGKLIARRRRDRLRKRAARSSGSPEDVQGTSDGQAQDGPQDAASRVTEPNPTEPTEQNSTNLTTSPPDGVDVSNEAQQLTRQFAVAVKGNGHAIPKANSNARDEWLIEMDRLLRLGPPGEGGVVPDPSEVATVIEWATTDDFERANVQSVPKFRKRYSQLRLKALSNGRSPPEKVSTFDKTERF